MKKLILLRHPEIEKNTQKRHGYTNKYMSFTRKGYEELNELQGFFIKSCKIRRIYCSSSTPCIITANQLTNRLKPNIISELKSIDFGVVSGLSETEVKDVYPEIFWQFQLYHSGILHPKDYQIPNAESACSFEQRIRKSLTRILNNSVSGDILVVAHRSTITMMLNVFRNYQVSVINRKYEVFNLPNSSLSIIEFDNFWSNPNISCIGSPMLNLEVDIGVVV